MESNISNTAPLLRGLNSFCGERFWDAEAWKSSNVPTLTQCFHHTALVWIPFAATFLISPVLTTQISNRNPSPLPWTRLLASKLAAGCVLIADALFLFIYAFYEAIFVDFPDAVEFIYPLMLCLSMILLTLFGWSCRRYGKVTSGALFMVWTLFAVCGLPELYYWMNAAFSSTSLDVPRFLAYLLWWPLCAAEAVMYAFADRPPHGYKPINEDGVPSPEMTSSFLNRLTMCWFNSACVKGKKKPLVVADLYALNDGDTSAVLVPQWFRLWDKAVNDYNGRHSRSSSARSHASTLRSRRMSDQTPLLTADAATDDYGSLPIPQTAQIKPPSIIWCLFKLFKWDIATAMLTKAVSDILTFCNPLLLK